MWTLRHDLHPPVGEIGGRPGQPEFQRARSHPPAKTDSLHGSADPGGNPYPFHAHLQPQATGRGRRGPGVNRHGSGSRSGYGPPAAGRPWHTGWHTERVTRVIAGIAGGRRIAVPGGRDTRPTSDRTREGLFSTVLSILGSLDDADVLDLYAGSGAVGLEALSRGARSALMIESDPRAARVIRENIAGLGLPGAELIADRVERVLRRTRDRPPGIREFDFVFADPPYALAASAVEQVLVALHAGGRLRAGALVCVERPARGEPLAWPDGFEAERVRRYGDAVLWYGHAAVP